MAENVECPTCDGEGRLVNLDRFGPDYRPCPDCTPENVKEPTTATHQTHYRHCNCLDDGAECCRPRCDCHPTPENVEKPLCATCEGMGAIRAFDQRRAEPCPDCTPENVEEP